MSSRVHLLAALVGLALVSGQRTAAADPPPFDPDPLPNPSAATVELGVGVLRGAERDHVAGGLLLTVPFPRWLDGPASAKAKGTKDATPARLREPASLPPETERGAADVRATSPAPDALLPRIRPGDARAAVAAALDAAGIDRREARVDGLAERARWSATLPTLRLRASQLVDQSQSLSPTSYDADRTTSSDGNSLWLEARATWTLDRLVFADEEVRLERIRQSLDEARERRADAALALLFGWQRAAVELLDPLLSPEACRNAWLREQQLAAELDLATGGWLTRWLRDNEGHRPEPSCAFDAQASAP